MPKASIYPFRLLALTLSLLSNTLAATENKTRVTVKPFENNAEGACFESGYSDLGSALAQQLASKLTELNRYDIESVQPKSKSKRAADYEIQGVIHQFDHCDEGPTAGVDVGRLMGFGEMTVGGTGDSAKVGFDLKVVENRSGKVLKTFRIEGKASRVKLNVEADIAGISFGSNEFYATPLGKATRKALVSATEKLQSVIPVNLVSSSEEQPTQTKLGQTGAAKGKTASPPKSQRTKHSSNIVSCDNPDGGCTRVKILETSASGKNFQVYNLFQRHKEWVAAETIFDLVSIASIKEIKIGDNLLSGVDEDDEWLTVCTVLDPASKSVIADCPGYSKSQVNIPIELLYRKVARALPTETTPEPSPQSGSLPQ